MDNLYSGEQPGSFPVWSCSTVPSEEMEQWYRKLEGVLTEHTEDFCYWTFVQFTVCPYGIP